LAKKKSKAFRIESKAPVGAGPIDAFLSIPRDDGRIGVDLRYFQKRHECFSEWAKDDLKAFSNWVEKMSGRTESQITAITQTCHAHKGKTKKLPAGISPDVKLYELDVGAKSRVHGFFLAGHFYLIWLDRNHAILKG